MKQRRTTKNFQHQIWALENLQSPPRDMGYVMTKFEVVEWSGGTVCATREYRNPDWKSSTMAYHESYQVGPRGAVKKIYSSLY